MQRILQGPALPPDAGKLSGPDVLFFENLVEQLDVSVLLRDVFPDEFMLADV